jgi:hypothetical protein
MPAIVSRLSVVVAQLVELRIVDPAVAGSSPVDHPARNHPLDGPSALAVFFLPLRPEQHGRVNL